MKIFGREPAAWIGVIEAGLAVFVLLFLHWSTNQVGMFMAVVVALFGCYTAWATKDTMVGVVILLAKALLALALGFGFQLAPDTAAALIAFVTIFMGFFNRQVTEPVAFPPPLPKVVVIGQS